jgi:PKD repeat protein
MIIEQLVSYGARGAHWTMLSGLLLASIAGTAMAADFSGSLKGITITDAQVTNKPPQANFTYTSNGSTFTFDASTSTDSDGSITAYKWDFGNGTTGTGVTASATYVSGTYPVTLTVVDNAQGVALTQQKVSYSEGVVLEDAEDGSISGWSIYDSDPTGATITNEFDTTRQSKIISLRGTSTDNGFQLAKSDGSIFGITGKNKMSFSFSTTSAYKIYLQVSTTSGMRYITYTERDDNILGSSTYIDYGLGLSSVDGNYHTFTRDIQEDLAVAQPNVSLISIDKVLVRGTLKIDDIVVK